MIEHKNYDAVTLLHKRLCTLFTTALRRMKEKTISKMYILQLPIVTRKKKRR